MLWVSASWHRTVNARASADGTPLTSFGRHTEMGFEIELALSFRSRVKIVSVASKLSVVVVVAPPRARLVLMLLTDRRSARTTERRSVSVCRYVWC